MRKTGKRANPNRPKAKLGLPDLVTADRLFLRVFARRSRSEATDTLWMSSSSGTALNRGYPSTRPWSPGTGFISKIDTSRQERSMDGSLLFGALPMKRRTRACSAQRWRPVSDA
jgi:hypothetical protein